MSRHIVNCCLSYKPGSRLLTLLLGAFCLVAQVRAADAPANLFGQDFTKTVITWQWARGRGVPDALGFRIYCGDYDNNSADGLTGYYTEMEQVADKTARSYLVFPMVLSLVKREGKPLGQYSNALRLRCKVVSYNAAGESEDGTSGVPSKPTSIKFGVAP